MISQLRPPPDGWSDLRKVLPDAQFYVGYHRDDNFTGAQLPGYAAPGAWMLDVPAQALAAVAEDLRAHQMVLVIFDAYRPFRGTQAMVAWAERTGQAHLLDDGYIARRSGHNHGHTVDLGLAYAVDGREVDMGTAWDTLDERSHTRNAEGAVLENRTLLKETMQRHGFQAYWKEWWHFSFAMEGTRGRDVPYGAQEPDEGAFVPPPDWGR